MPGKVATRSSTSSRVSKKSSVRNSSSRKPVISRTTSPDFEIPDEGPSSTLRRHICQIFSSAQSTATGHRKLVIGLRKVQEACCYESEEQQGGNGFREDDFNVEIARCVIRLMAVKKSEGVADRIIKFLGLFLKYACEKDATLSLETDVEATQMTLETSSTRLVSHILSILLHFLVSKEKTVRYRSTQLVSHIINSLDSIDDEDFKSIKTGLLKRVRDKEPMIRVQAVLGLGRLAGNEDDENPDDVSVDDEHSTGLLEKLLEILQNDPSADVRRSLLLNLPLTSRSLPYLLERARDSDPATRRALYSRLLPTLGDFRHLSLTMREKLLRWGLRDRDENVRRATAKLFADCWIEHCARTQNSPEDMKVGESVPPSIDGLLELLERIDVVNSAVENGIALEAMQEFWNARPDYLRVMDFDNTFWDHLTPESVFMARSFNDFCRQRDEGKNESLMEEKMPEVTEIAFFLQRHMNGLVDILKNSAENEGQEDPVEQEFIVEQLLQIAKTADYRDEVGRRKMFSLLRETLAIAELPDDITKQVVDVLREVCGPDAAGERELCSIVLEAVAEVHDTISMDEPMRENQDESFHSARSEISDTTPTKNNEVRMVQEKDVTEEDENRAIREIMVNMKCLHIAQCMLQNVEGNLQQNLHLVTTLNSLVVPAVRSHEAPIRERGLLCLGLCCLLDKNLAEENLSLFLHCFNKGHEALQVTAIQVICDILTTHPSLMLTHDSDLALQKSVFKVFGKTLKTVNSPEVQAAGVMALCKLMLLNVIQEEDLIKQTVICYFDPATKGNAAVRQALSYFLPVYCYSRRSNMECVASVAPAVLHHMLSLVEESNEEEEIVGISVVGSMLIDWTDARKLVAQNDQSSWDEIGKREVKSVNGDIHLNFAQALLDRIMSHGCTREERKAFIPLLGKLYISTNSSPEKLRDLHNLVREVIDKEIANEAASRNALNKLETALTKAMSQTGVNSKPAGDIAVDVTQEEVALAGESKGDREETRSAFTPQGSLLEELLDDEDE